MASLTCVCGREAILSALGAPHEAVVIRCPNADTCPGSIVIKPTERGARMAWSRVMRERRTGKGFV